MPAAPHGPSSHSQGTPPARLDSWKEIAEYLGRSERTVKRWEAERALPVHHVPGGGHGSVYAFTSELDRWLLSEKKKDSHSLHESGETKVPSAAQSSGAPPQDPAESSWASEQKSLYRRIWHLLTYGFPVLSILVVFLYIVGLRTTGASSSSLFRSILTFVRTGSTSSSATSEKQLAHDLYLRGRFEWNKRTPDSLSRALDYFLQSVVHDPDNAQAYVGLADTYLLLREFTIMPENEAYDRAIAAAKKAIQIDDSLADGHRALAFAEIYRNWDFQTGETEFRRALELNPRDPVTHLWFANAFAAPGWYPVCLREIERAQELDPSSQAILADKGLMLFQSGQVHQGLDLEREVERTDPEFLSPHRYLASMYFTLRDYPNFLLESDKAADVSNDAVLKSTTAAARSSFVRGGEPGLLQALYASQKSSYSAGKLPATILAKTCAHMGRKEEALHLLREDYRRHGIALLIIRGDVDLLTLSQEPEYQDLLREIHSPSPHSLVQ